MITEPGVYSLSLDEYLADPCPEPSLSSHIAHTLLTRSPRHARAEHPRLNPDYRADDSAAMDLGTLAHRIVVEGCPGDVAVVHASDYRTKGARAVRDAARAAGQIPMLEAQWIAVETMVTAWQAQFRELDPIPFQGGEPERAYIWRRDGIWCRARPDYVTAWGVDDLKTTSTSGHPEDWTRRRLWDAGYDLQAAMHVLGVGAVGHRRVDTYRFLVCETEAPYGVSAISLDAEAWDFANTRLASAIIRWGDCLASGIWPGYPARTCYAEVPPYLKARWLTEAYYR